MCHINAYSEAVKVFRERDPEVMTRNAGAQYDAGRQVITVKYLGAAVETSFPDGEITCTAPWELLCNDEVLILQYLISSCGVPPRQSWVSFIQLPDGPHHHTPFILEAVDPIAREFGDKIAEFRKRAALFGGEPTDMGDCGMVIPVFPHIPLAFSVWEGDDEFPPNANILFDITAPLHLTTAALWVMGVEVSRKLRGTVGQQYS